jgi:CDGSH-type Zn-finger protein
VFVPNVSGEWIHPDAATADEVAEIAHNCPSGAITYERIDGDGERAPLVNVVRVRENGPLAFHAELNIGGKPFGMRATLCRCGASNSKPYCDSSHTAAHFAATGEPKAQDSPPLGTRGGPLDVTATPNGPLKVAGSLEVVSGTGHTISRTTETYLCRCGASANKPYCDGSHTRVGFKSA